MDPSLGTVDKRTRRDLLVNECAIGSHAHRKHNRPLIDEEGLPLAAMRVRRGPSAGGYLEIKGGELVASLPCGGQRRVQVRRRVVCRPPIVVFLANYPYAGYRGFSE